MHDNIKNRTKLVQDVECHLFQENVIYSYNGKAFLSIIYL